jgi:hypothetical protein
LVSYFSNIDDRSEEKGTLYKTKNGELLDRQLLNQFAIENLGITEADANKMTSQEIVTELTNQDKWRKIVEASGGTNFSLQYENIQGNNWFGREIKGINEKEFINTVAAGQAGSPGAAPSITDF